MKKVSLLVIFAVVGFALFAQTANKPASEQLPEDILALQTANALARYGYQAQSASALIGAAEIYASVRTQPLGIQPTREQTGSDSVTTPEFTPANLLADGKRLAGRDRTMLAWADEVQKSLNTRTRGAVGGPKFATNVIPAGGTHTYEINFRAGEQAVIEVYSSGAGDLDLYVYDVNGLFIADERTYFNAGVFFPVARAGIFRIVVRNCGPYAARYELYTN